VCVIERDGRLAAFFPYQFRGRLRYLLRAAEPVGGDMSDYFGLIAPAGFVIDVSSLLALAQLSATEFRNLPAAELAFGLTGEQPERGHRIEIGPAARDYWVRLKEQNESLSRELERRERRVVEALGPLEFRFDVTEKDHELEHLVAMKRAQYRRTGAADALAEPWRRELLRSLASSRDPDCTGVLSTLRAGEHWIASHFGLRCGATLHYWFPVYNAALAKFGPGHLLLKHVIDGAGAAGVRTIDRGAGHQVHKSAYVTESRVYYRGCWHDASLRAVMFRGLQSVAWRWRARRNKRRRLVLDEDT
jgi:CelD/BcsL family acetyltransferase involved in cellulose biosynthesis